MFSNDEPFQIERLDEQLDALARGAGQPPATPTSRAYAGLRQLHAAQAEQEAQAIERVRLRLAAQAAQTGVQQQAPRESALVSAAPPQRLPPSRHPSRLRALVSVAAAVLVPLLIVGGFAALLHTGHRARGSIAVQPAWQVIASPNSSLQLNGLSAVSFSSSTDGWAVGTAQNQQPSTNPIVEMPLVEHWNGLRWQVVSTPALPGAAGLSDVVSLAPNDAWAVGSVAQATDQPVAQALIEHWDGSQWSLVPSHVSAASGSGLMKLAALSADDIWAVGTYSDSTASHGLIEHWNGTEWQAVAQAATSEQELFIGIAALTPDNIWAAGTAWTSDQQHSHTVIEHWDGSRWSLVPSPNTSLSANTLVALSAVSANDIWAAGFAINVDTPPYGQETLFEHWDGQRWSIVANPQPALSGVAAAADIIALGPDNVWAVGATASGPDAPQTQGLIEHWDGRHWSVSATQHSQNFISLMGMTRDPSTPGKLWIVGSAGSSGLPLLSWSDSTFIETSR